MSSISEKQLLPHEWLAIAFISLLMLAVGAIAYVHDAEIPDLSVVQQEEPMQKEIEVLVEGAVEAPGPYRLKKGSRMEDLLKQLTLLPEADISKLKPTTKLRNGQKIRIPKKGQKRRGR